MVATTVGTGCRVFSVRSVARTALLGTMISLAGTGVASAYIGDSFLSVPGVTGDWQGAPYKDWVRADGNYWPGHTQNRGRPAKPMNFPGPLAQEHGQHELVLSINKQSPVLPELMEACASKTEFPEAAYAESSGRTRSFSQLGSRPSDMPAYFEYKLTDVQFKDCPVVAEAPDQAIIVSFKDLAWTNYHGSAEGEPAVLKPVNLKPAKAGPTTRSYVLNWFGVANLVSDDQCPKMNVMSTEDDYYALMSKEDADKERAVNAKNGGVNYFNFQMALRGPHKLDVTALPGIVKDPGHAYPVSKIAHGFNLDGNDGTGAPAPGTCAHKNYALEDGGPGIDNQLFTVEGCVSGLQGKKGWMIQFGNNQMHDGAFSMLVQITGIDNEKNDSNVDVTIFYSLDRMAKSATGTLILPHYTFRLTDNMEYTPYFTRLHGRIVNGVLITEPVKSLEMNLGYYGTPAVLKLTDARLRLQLMPDGTMRGVIGGYEDWKKIATGHASSMTEQMFQYNQPALYNAYKRAADGLKNPVSGECEGISAAYEMEGIPAFIGPAEHEVAKGKEHHQLAQAEVSGQKAP